MNVNIKRLMATALFLATSYICMQAQELQAKLSHYSTDDGLASNAIAKIRQDNWGFIWIGTWNGLSRFDGYDFYNYQTGTASHIPNLHNRISQLSIDSQQNVWMRMYDNRIFVLKRTEDRIINPFEGIMGCEEFRTDRFVVTTSGGDVLVPIIDKGLYKLRVEADRVDCKLVITGDLTVTSMAEGYQNDIWLGTNQGIHRMDASNLTVEQKGMFLDEYITCLFSNGYNIYAGTQSGKIVSFAYGQDPVVIRQGGNSEIHGLFIDSHGLIWFADNSMGVLKLDPQTGIEKRYTQTVKMINYDSGEGEFREVDGVVWVHMNHGGYGYYDRQTDEVRYFHNDPSNPWNLSNTCNASYETSDGVVFESTSRRGLEKLEIMNNTIERKLLVENPEKTFDNDIRALCYYGKQRRLLMANKSGTLFLIDDDGNRSTITQSDSGQPLGRIYGISKDSKDNIWISSKDNGVFRMTPKADGGFSIVNYRHDDSNPQSMNDDRAYQTVEDAQGNIWVATYGGGVNLMPKGTAKFIHCKNGMDEYPRNAFRKVRTLALDKDGKVWAGTTDGILIFSYEKGKVKIEHLEPSEEQPENILMSNDVVCMARDNKGMMWVGTNGGGLGHTTGKDSKGKWIFENFGSHNGLPSEEILSIAFDSRGNVWFATEHILCSFDQEKRIFTTFSTLDGVDETMCSEGAALVMPNGNILFGTTNGYYLVDRNKLTSKNAAIFRLHFTAFWVDGVMQSPRMTNLYDYYVPDSKEVTLPSGSSSFALRFVSLNYQLQHRVHYQYMLEGYDKEWQNAGKERTATYKEVPAGTYKLMVKAFLLESPDKYDLKEMTITVPPSFFFTSGATWLYMALTAAFGIALLFISQKRIRDKARKNRRDSMADSGEQWDTTKDGFMKQLEEWMQKHYAEQGLSFDTFMQENAISRADLEDAIKSHTRMSPKEFMTYYRLEKAQQMLEQTNDSVADVSYNTGFADPALFNRMFTAKTGMTPSQYRDHHHQAAAGATDYYEIIEEK